MNDGSTFCNKHLVILLIFKLKSVGEIMPPCDTHLLVLSDMVVPTALELPILEILNGKLAGALVVLISACLLQHHVSTRVSYACVQIKENRHHVILK